MPFGLCCLLHDEFLSTRPAAVQRDGHDSRWQNGSQQHSFLVLKRPRNQRSRQHRRSLGRVQRIVSRRYLRNGDARPAVPRRNRPLRQHGIERRPFHLLPRRTPNDHYLISIEIWNKYKQNKTLINTVSVIWWTPWLHYPQPNIKTFFLNCFVSV